MRSAADALDDSDFEKANGRQMDALEILRHAWTIVASSMASLSDVAQSNANQRRPPPDNEASGTGGGGGTSETIAGDSKPWYCEPAAAGQGSDRPVTGRAVPAQVRNSGEAVL